MCCTAGQASAKLRKEKTTQAEKNNTPWTKLYLISVSIFEYFQKWAYVCTS